jgi:drug/metabolite transporter (DMT)-like permease
MKKSVEIFAHIFFWIIYTAFIIMLAKIFQQAKPDAPFSQHLFYVAFLGLIMGLILFYTTFLGIRLAGKNIRNLLILSAILLFILAFFAIPAMSHGIWQVMSSIIPHIIVIFLAFVFRSFSESLRLEKEKQLPSQNLVAC